MMDIMGRISVFITWWWGATFGINLIMAMHTGEIVYVIVTIIFLVIGMLRVVWYKYV